MLADGGGGDAAQRRRERREGGGGHGGTGRSRPSIDSGRTMGARLADGERGRLTGWLRDGLREGGYVIDGLPALSCMP